MAKKKGYTLAGTYPTFEQAQKVANKLYPKVPTVEIRSGTKGAAWGKSKKAYRVYVK